MGGRLWVHQGEAQGTTYTIKYVAQDSVPQQAIDDGGCSVCGARPQDACQAENPA